ncbi:MAG: phosphoribosylanthranilate isomerase [Acutalibacteraceae bacterium]|nr:phosphoribosylanthranilate isomerase [Acutalibacteraceae bacterium]
MTKIKMCGMMNTSDVIAVKELKVDYAGFILSQGFKRSISYNTFDVLLGYLADTNIKKVGVFVNESIDLILNRYSDKIDIIQLHGSEDDIYIEKLKSAVNKPIIKAFKIKTEDDVKAAQRSKADMILLDSGVGSGKLFDHGLLDTIQRDYFLAGGLDAENIGDILNKLSPYAVDISSGIETNGKKDIIKMKAFANAVRRKT